MANQQNITPSLAQTPLYQTGVELKAKFTSFGGWEMPIQYSSITQEHHAVRNTAGMFDISHMGKFTLQGKNVISQLEYLVPSDLSRLQSGQAQYTVLLNPQGGIIDDIIIYYQGTDTTNIQKVVIIVNAATTDKDKTWILTHLDPDVVEFQDLSRDKILIALQGPTATSHLQSLVTNDLSPIKAFGHLETTIFGKHAFLARTGYTGEDGFEIFLDLKDAVGLWQKLIDFGAKPAGLACRDTLRLEAGMPLYGHELDLQTNPIEAGLGRVIAFGKSIDFIGKSALAQIAESSTKRNLVGITLETRRIARAGFNLINKDGEIVGQITSGAFSPTLNKSIAMAYLDRNFDAQLDTLSVDIRGTNELATLVPLPFYQRKK